MTSQSLSSHHISRSLPPFTLTSNIQHLKSKDMASQDASKTDSEPTASYQVFHITELLEQILLDVSQLDLFVMQRISTTFNTTITSTPALQRRMYTTSLPGSSTSNPTKGPGSFAQFSNHLPLSTVNSPHGASLRLFHAHLSNLYFYPFTAQLFPHIPYPFQTGDLLTHLVLIFHGGLTAADTDPMGWEGASGTFHQYGSWERIALKASEVGVVEVRATGMAGRRRGIVQVEGGTLGELVEGLRISKEREKGLIDLR